MEPLQEFESLKDSVTSQLVSTIRSVNALANEDLPFQRTVNPSVAKGLDDANERILAFANKLINSAGALTGVNVPVLDDVEDVDIRWKTIVDVIDGLLEKADTSLDDYTGLIKRKDGVSFDVGRDPKRSKSTTLDLSLKRANIPKPQEFFEKKANNFDNGAWKPILSRKPHAKRTFEDSVVPFTDEENKLQFRHPYEFEIMDLKFPEHVYEQHEPIRPLPIDSTPATWVDTYEQVLEMLEELKGASEIAVDLEHHDRRTYRGLLSLMQISTREKDWLVDTLVPWRHKLEILNEVFADPKIIKVFHGAASDIIWLQRDLGLYIVGLFDTYNASNALCYGSKSLAFLLKKFVDFDADKKYQLADWRIRPIPEEMAYYAQSDTHFLLYIYDMVRNELVANSVRGDEDKDLIEFVLQRSKETALSRYENPIYDAENGGGPLGWHNALTKFTPQYNGEQFSVYKAVHQWRDDIARLKDENPFEILDQHSLADIARIIPTDKMALWNLVSKNRGIKDSLDDLFNTIQRAQVEGVNGPTLLAFLKSEITARNGPAPKPALKPVEGERIPIEQLKSKRSQLWGDIPMSTRWEPVKKPSKLYQSGKIVIPYPLPSSEAMIDVGVDEARTKNTSLKDDRQVSPQQPKAIVDQEFTLRNGRKRKVNEREQEPQLKDEASYESGMDVDSDSPAAEPVISDSEAEEETSTSASSTKKKRKAERKAEKKALKKAKSEAKSEDTTDPERDEKAARKAERKAAKKAEQKMAAKEQEQKDGAQEDETPFNYSKADSVLHAEKQNSKQVKGKKTFNPYSDKSGDAPKGERRVGLVKKGKSATFK